MIFNNDIAFNGDFIIHQKSMKKSQNNLEMIENSKKLIIDYIGKIKDDFEDHKFES
jgi:hypothetical protein